MNSLCPVPDIFKLPQIITVDCCGFGVPAMGIESLVPILRDGFHLPGANAPVVFERRSVIEVQQAIHVVTP
jgi:hypothetical protein